jgi:predicted RNase H-like nuclease (RuvC/YqgF family)
MKVHKDDRGEHDLERRIEQLQLENRSLKDTLHGYDFLLESLKKEIFEAKKIASENEKNKNLLQGYKKVIEDLSIKLRKNS